MNQTPANRWVWALGIALLVAAPALVAEEDLIVSETLRSELVVWFDEFVNSMPPEKRTPPPGMTLEDMKKKVLEQYTAVLGVTKAQEEKLKQRQYDDRDNREKMNGAIQKFEAMKIDLPTPVQGFIKQHKDGSLVGLRLELAVRMNNLVLYKIQQSLERQQGAPEK